MSTNQNTSITVLGSGSYGTALACVLAKNGMQVCLWGRDTNQIAQMVNSRENSRYMPGVTLPDNIDLCSDLEVAVQQNRHILIAVPSHSFRHLCRDIKPFLRPDARLVWASKGLDPESGSFLEEVVCEEINDTIACAVLSGPTFAKELALDLPTATTIASRDAEWLALLTQYFHNDNFRVYSSNDMVGVQLCGAVKNVIAVGAGMADGLGFGANARTALITRGIAELTRLGIACGGNQATFSGMAGLGDLVLTCTDDQSRNRRFGLALGRGKPKDEAENAIGQVVEAVRNAKEVFQLAQKYQVEMPIIEQIYEVLHNGRPPVKAAKELMTRALKSEG